MKANEIANKTFSNSPAYESFMPQSQLWFVNNEFVNEQREMTSRGDSPFRKEQGKPSKESTSGKNRKVLAPKNLQGFANPLLKNNYNT